ncbi:hypothetical protein TREMEDRAFT_60212 [Tremella mesenterica DSM 1558]|uniref:uncharacterized protein n=1 Tax=Tremella mesenterica (strain ATCC 24925 / CBS 8224 / DSM 1558 / NBRC 9311 / NRRL Y-6157 / RJB 2259-6 / UBC 559-6) TaxID=578456 RepID=UPI0003F49730|nr:uncharacterized protein TREMEDRAFT_60212 [Tremella mesenterica DSM 1558]EIW71282.1 hypothetical protein TREMEDRAFT_60212 [Tremella mesenterica DSM 1558]
MTLVSLDIEQSASPVVLALFAAAVYWTIRPCGYCIVLFSILFLSTSPSSPLTPSPTSITPKVNLSLSAADPDRRWLSTNGGRIFDPFLIAYVEWDRLISSSSSFSPSSSSSFSSESTSTQSSDSSPESTSTRSSDSSPGSTSTQSSDSSPETNSDFTTIQQIDLSVDINTKITSTSRKGLVDWIFSRNHHLSRGNEEDEMVRDGTRSKREEGDLNLPKGYYDFSWRGIGFVLDLNPRRTDQGLAWELSQARRRPFNPETSQSSKVNQSRIDENENDPSEVDSKPIHQDSRWKSIPFVGSW